MVTIREMDPGEEASACSLVQQVFTEFVAPHYANEGVREFFRYADPQSMVERMRSGCYVLVAEKGEQLIGILEMRHLKHISLLFVARDFQRQGISRQLIDAALQIALRAKPDLSWVSVHASPNSVMAYEALGFRAEGPEKEEHGIRFIPMKKVIRSETDG